MNCSHTNDPAALNRLERLVASRYHGAGNHRAVRYHILIAVSELLSRLGDEAFASMHLEHLEDIDLSFTDKPSLHIQVKGYSSALTVPELAKIFKSFGNVLESDRESRFKIVSQSGYCDLVADFTSGLANRGLPKAFAKKVQEVTSRSTADTLFKRTKFESRSELDAYKEALHLTSVHFEATLNSELYLDRLFALLVAVAGNRGSVTKLDLANLKLEVDDLIAQGPQSVAIQSGMVKQVQFQADGVESNYFSGRNARPADIGANLDVYRPEEQAAIHEALQQAEVCVILASSGQGKSTLAFRYAKNVSPTTTFIVRSCESEEQAGAIAEVLNKWSAFGLQITVIIDNLGFATREWHRLVGRISRVGVKVLVTSREEDWIRYGNRTAGFSYRQVSPSLSKEVATQIYGELSRRSLIHPNVQSLDWAYSKVFDRKLLIEFVYLLTHGTLLQDRLQEQLAELEKEDTAKLEVLKLISLADRLHVSVSIESILDRISFAGEPQRALKSLEGEYVVFDGSVCVGLHPVRSEHLARLLHPLGFSETIVRLCDFVSLQELPALALGALSDMDIRVDKLIARLVNLARSDLETNFEPLYEACLQASEREYVAANISVFDECREVFGSAGTTMLLYATMPQLGGHLDTFLGLFGNERGQQFKAMVEKLRSRDSAPRFEREFLDLLTEAVGPQMLASNLEVLAEVAICSKACNSVFGIVQEAFKTSNWQERIWAASFDTYCLCSLALFRIAPEDYLAWRDANQDKVLARFKRETRSLLTTLGDRQIAVRFHVDMTGSGPGQNQQALDRLKPLTMLFADLDRFDSDPAYPLGDSAFMPFEEARKEIPRENLPLDWDIKINVAYRLAVERYLQADDIYGWFKSYSDALADCRAIISGLLELVAQKIDGRQISQSVVQECRAPLMRWFEEGNRLPDFPSVIDHRESIDLANYAKTWHAEAYKVIDQGLKFLEAPDDDQNLRLLTFNSASLANSIPGIHRSLELAAKWCGISYQLEAAQKDEATVRALQNLCLMLQEPEAPRTGDAIALAKRLQSKIEADVLDRIRRAISAKLPSAASKILVPETMIWYEQIDDPELPFTPLRSVVLGLKSNSLEDATSEAEALVFAVVEEVREGFDWVYVVPCFEGLGRYPRVFRASVSTIRNWLENHERDGFLIYPVECFHLPNELETLSVWKPIEETLVEGFLNAGRKLAMSAALIRDCRLMLDPRLVDEHDLLVTASREFEEEQGEGSGVNHGLAALERHVTQRESDQAFWNDLVQFARAVVASAISSPEDFLYTSLGFGVEVTKFVSRAYLN